MLGGMGRTVDRGYGREHRKERARWEPVVEAGQAWCCAIVCIMPVRWIPPGSKWDLGHNPDRTAYLGPCHQECNRSEGGRRGNAHWPKAVKAREKPRWRPTTNW